MLRGVSHAGGSNNHLKEKMHGRKYFFQADERQRFKGLQGETSNERGSSSL